MVLYIIHCSHYLGKVLIFSKKFEFVLIAQVIVFIKKRCIFSELKEKFWRSRNPNIVKELARSYSGLQMSEQDPWFMFYPFLHRSPLESHAIKQHDLGLLILKYIAKPNPLEIGISFRKNWDTTSTHYKSCSSDIRRTLYIAVVYIHRAVAEF